MRIDRFVRLRPLGCRSLNCRKSLNPSPAHGRTMRCEPSRPAALRCYKPCIAQVFKEL